MFDVLTFASTALGVFQLQPFDVTSRIEDKMVIEYQMPNCAKSFDKQFGDSDFSSNLSTKAETAFATLTKNKILSKLNSFSSLQYGWDGYGAMPISPSAIKNIESIVSLLVQWNFTLWQLAPGSNGDIFINYKGKDKMASIIVADCTYSFYVEAGTLVGKDKISFNEREIVELMFEIENK